MLMYTGFRIYGPRWDQLKIDHIAEIQVQFWIYGQFYSIWEIGTTPKLTNYPKRPYIRRPYNRNRVYIDTLYS